MVGNIVLVGVLTHCALLHSVYDLKAAQINMQCCLIWDLILYKFELGHNTSQASKNICCIKSDDAGDHSTVTRWLKKFCLGCKNLNHLASSEQDSDAVLQAIEVNLVSITWAWHLISMWFITFMTFAKVSRGAELCLMLTK